MIQIIRIRFDAAPTAELVLDRLRRNTGLDVGMTTPQAGFVVFNAAPFVEIECRIAEKSWEFDAGLAEWWSYLRWQLICALIELGGRYVPPVCFPRWLFLTWEEKGRDHPEVPETWPNILRGRYNR